MSHHPLLTPRWFLALVLVIAAVITCVLLGLWQYHRFEAASAAKTVIETNYDAPAVPLEDVLPSTSSALDAEDDYTVVTATGHYCTDPECVLYVRNRALSSTVGFWQLVPFTTTSGSELLVVRGWTPASATESAPGASPDIPSGEVTIEARLRPMEPHLAGRDPITGQVPSVNPEDVVAQVPEVTDPWRGAYAVVSQEAGASPFSEVLYPLEQPSTSLGPHLSYAFQWWVFAIFFPVGFVVAARRALQDHAASEVDAAQVGTTDPERGVDSKGENGEQAAGAGRSQQPAGPTGAGHPERAGAPASRYGGERRRPSRRTRTDEDEEDTLLDRGRHT